MSLELWQEVDQIKGMIGDLDTPDRGLDLISPFLALPGLRGFWPMSAFDSSGNAQDVSGHGHHLTYNGNPTYNFDATFYSPYLDFDATGDYLTLGDTGDLDIIGTESYVASAAQGLTLGGWFYPDVTGLSFLIGKANDTAGPYGLFNSATATDVLFRVRDSGDATNYDATGTTMALTAWQFIVGRYTPSTEVKVWIDNATTANTTSIPASLLNGTDGFHIGANNGSNLLDGRASLCFLCATALDDAIISSLFQATRGGFGV